MKTSPNIVTLTIAASRVDKGDTRAFELDVNAQTMFIAQCDNKGGILMSI